MSKPKPHGRRYTEPEKERGLVALAYCSGHGQRASELLKKQGLRIPVSTLAHWRRTKPELYAKAREEILPRLRAELAEAHTGMAQRGITLTHRFYDRIETALDKDDIPARDLAGAMRNAAVTAAIGTDKANVLRGQPTEIVGRTDLTGLRRALEAKGFVIEGTAEELPDPPQIERESVDA